MEAKGEALPRLKGYVDFTSPENTSGLALNFVKTKRGAAAKFTIPDHMGGWQWIDRVEAHPGPVDGALQTAMGFAAIYEFKSAARMKSFQVEYLDSVLVGQDLIAEASVLGQRGNEVVMEAVVKDASGNVLVKGTASFDLFSIEKLKDLRMCNPSQLGDFEQMLSSV